MKDSSFLLSAKNVSYREPNSNHMNIKTMHPASELESNHHAQPMQNLKVKEGTLSLEWYKSKNSLLSPKLSNLLKLESRPRTTSRITKGMIGGPILETSTIELQRPSFSVYSPDSPSAHQNRHKKLSNMTSKEEYPTSGFKRKLFKHLDKNILNHGSSRKSPSRLPKVDTNVTPLNVTKAISAISQTQASYKKTDHRSQDQVYSHKGEENNPPVWVHQETQSQANPICFQDLGVSYNTTRPLGQYDPPGFGPKTLKEISSKNDLIDILLSRR